MTNPSLRLVAATLVFILRTPTAASSAAEPLPAVLRAHAEPPPEFAGDFGPFQSPLSFDDGRPVRTADDWPARRAEIRTKWLAMLGGDFELLAAPQVEFVRVERRENFAQHRVRIEIAAGGKRVDGYLLVPDGPGPFPAVLVPFYEPETSIGRGKPGTEGAIDFGLQLTRRGFVSLSIGTPGEIEMNSDDTRTLLVGAGDELQRQPLGYLAHVAANCNTVLRSLPYVDTDRIGIVGHSYGGKWSMFASCLDDRFAAACWCDPGIVLDESNRNINYWEPWYLGWQSGEHRKPGVPTADNPRTGLYKTLYEHASREMIELHALAAPRPILLSGGSEDRPAHWRAFNHLIAVNKLLGYENRAFMTTRDGHRPTPEAVAVIYAFFEHFLK